MPLFERYIGVDYSGASTAESSLKEIRVYAATPSTEPREVMPPTGPRKYWSRRGVANHPGQSSAGLLRFVSHASCDASRCLHIKW